MRKKKGSNIVLSSDSLEDFIWMSYRYCIGRRTIASAMHAATIASVIKSNPNILSDERIRFMVNDIRDEVNSCLNWGDSFQLSSCYGIDAFSPALYKSNEVDNPNDWVYCIDGMGNVRLEEPNGKKRDIYDEKYSDLIPWVKLANLLDKSCHCIVTTEYNCMVEKTECFPYPLKFGNKYKQVWCSCKETNISINKWICDEYITKIESI